MIDETIQTRRDDESNDERAVSPVIGVILMVAITVILAAVIAAFVLDLGPGSPDPSGAVSVSGDAPDDNITVQLTQLDSSADAVVVVNNNNQVINNTDDEHAALTITGQSEEFEISGEGYTVQAVSVADEEDINDLGSEADIDNVTDARAILENL